MTINSISAISLISAPGSSMELGSQMTNVDQSSSFFNMIGEKLNSIDSSIKQSDGLMQAYIKGESVPVHEIMIALGKAKTEIQLAVEIRNKVLESYQEITRIQL